MIFVLENTSLKFDKNEKYIGKYSKREMSFL